jgi:hypothetical protein
VTEFYKPTWTKGQVRIEGYHMEIDRKRSKLYCFDTGDLRYVKFKSQGWSWNPPDEVDDVHFHLAVAKLNKEHLDWPDLKSRFKGPWTQLSIPVPKDERWSFFTKTYKRYFDVMIYQRDD